MIYLTYKSIELTYNINEIMLYNYKCELFERFFLNTRPFLFLIIYQLLWFVFNTTVSFALIFIQQSTAPIYYNCDNL